MLNFYITAHQDDWQLFRGSMGYDDLNRDDHTAFIITTAGDAGYDWGWWKAREVGFVASVQAALSSNRTIPSPPYNLPSYATVTINGKSLTTLQLAGQNANPATATIYFLRLPDGGGNGEGFGLTGNVSLLQLSNSTTLLPLSTKNPDCFGQTRAYSTDKISQMSTIDGSNTYTGWSDFADTIAGIIQTEMTAYNNATVAAINAPDWCMQCSGGDHADHKATAYAVRQVIEALIGGGSLTFGRNWWVSYQTVHCEVNLSDDQIANQLCVVQAYVQAINDFCVTTLKHSTELLPPPTATDWGEYKDWGRKQYSRAVQAGDADTPDPSCGPCTGTSA